MLLRIAARRAGLKTRAWLVCDAIESLASNGFRRPTVAQIAERAGVSKRTTERALRELVAFNVIQADRWHPGRGAIVSASDPLGINAKRPPN